MTTQVEQAGAVRLSRQVERLLTGEDTSDGAGVKLTRLLDRDLQPRLDPFLMLDFFHTDDSVDYVAGFPNHPHRGFETLTYLLAGRMRHSDSAGNSGLLETGGIQWMCAGSGIIHSEMPEQREGLLEGFQLWLNLAAADKMQTPWYRDVQSADIPEYLGADGLRVRVIAGACLGVGAAIRRPVTEPLFLDLIAEQAAGIDLPLPAGHNAFVYVYRGRATLGGGDIDAGRMAILSTAADQDGVSLTLAAGSRLILAAGAPLHEPIVQHGPFVMNSEAEIAQAIADFKSGRFHPPRVPLGTALSD